MRRRKLRTWVKVVLFILFVGAMYLLLLKGCERYNNIAEECDSYYGYTCSHYMVDQYGKGIRNDYLRK